MCSTPGPLHICSFHMDHVSSGTSLRLPGLLTFFRALSATGIPQRRVPSSPPPKCISKVPSQCKGSESNVGLEEVMGGPPLWGNQCRPCQSGLTLVRAGCYGVWLLLPFCPCQFALHHEALVQCQADTGFMLSDTRTASPNPSPLQTSTLRGSVTTENRQNVWIKQQFLHCLHKRTRSLV